MADEENHTTVGRKVMGHISCVTVTTLVLISLANMLLLLSIVLESGKKCSENYFESRRNFISNLGKKVQSLFYEEEVQRITEERHIAALYVIKYDSILLVCGTTIVSRYWVLTAAHCCELVRIYPLEKVKISSNSGNWKNGVTHDVLEIVKHGNFSQKSVSHNLCLIKVSTPFLDMYEVPAPLATSKYKYLANSSALTLGWGSADGRYENDRLYKLKVNLVPYAICRNLHKLKIDETMLCAKHSGTVDCLYDSGGPIFQNGLAIGVVSFETNCASGVYPRVYTRISYFEKWFRSVEQARKESLGIEFGTK